MLGQRAAVQSNRVDQKSIETPPPDEEEDYYFIENELRRLINDLRYPDILFEIRTDLSRQVEILIQHLRELKSEDPSQEANNKKTLIKVYQVIQDPKKNYQQFNLDMQTLKRNHFSSNDPNPVRTLIIGCLCVFVALIIFAVSGALILPTGYLSLIGIAPGALLMGYGIYKIKQSGNAINKIQAEKDLDQLDRLIEPYSKLST